MVHIEEVEGFFESIDPNNTARVSQFLKHCIREKSREIDLLNAICIALFRSNNPVGKSFITLFLTYNTSVEDFAKIDWIKSSGVRSYSAGTITGDLRARQWEEVLVKVEAMKNPLT